MARVRKTQPSLDALLFSTPEQKVLRFLLSEPTTTFTPRVISSRLKGVRGLGGSDGIIGILTDFESLGLVDFVDNRRAVRLREDTSTIQMLKTVAALCDLEGLRRQLEPISVKGVLFGSRAIGRARSDSDYDLLVVSDTPEEVKKVTGRHPLGKHIELLTFTSDSFDHIERLEPQLAQKLSRGIVMWGVSW